MCSNKFANEDVYDYTNLINSVVEPPKRVVRAGLLLITVPRGVHVTHQTDGGVCIDLKCIKYRCPDISYTNSVCKNTEELLEQYKLAMFSLSKSSMYVNANHEEFFHTSSPRVSISKQNYKELDITHVKGIVLVKCNRWYFINLSLNRKNITRKIAQIDSVDIRSKVISKINAAILSKGDLWIKSSPSAQEFLKNHVA